MNPVLLDGVAAGFFFILFGFGLVFIIVVVLLEAWIMKKMKYHESFNRARLDALVANLLSLGSGFIVLRFIGNEAPDMNNIWEFLAYFGATLLVESIYLLLANRGKPIIHCLKVCAVMNTVTYLIALIVILAFFT